MPFQVPGTSMSQVAPSASVPRKLRGAAPLSGDGDGEVGAVLGAALAAEAGAEAGSRVAAALLQPANVAATTTAPTIRRLRIPGDGT